MANSTDNRALVFLGRRAERLIFGGILLVVLCAIEAYLTTANKQLSEDHSASSLVSLLAQLEARESSLTDLFQLKPDAISPIPSLNDILEHQKLVSDTRKKLGLPPPLPPSGTSDRPQQPRTYKDALETIISELGNDHFSNKAEIRKYADPSKSPKELIQALHEQIKARENVPATVWGIQSPRILQLQYAGLDYKLPYWFVSGILEVALAPLIIGWFGALYATRQRELKMIFDLDDYKLAFPYILNFLPVHFRSLDNRTLASNKSTSKMMNFIRIVLSIFRTFVILVIALPLFLGFTYSLIQLKAVVENEMTYLFYAGIAMAIVMFLQVLFLVLQEWVILDKKRFYE